jgi:hypothetical protein
MLFLLVKTGPEHWIGWRPRKQTAGECPDIQVGAPHNQHLFTAPEHILNSSQGKGTEVSSVKVFVWPDDVKQVMWYCRLLHRGRLRRPDIKVAIDLARVGTEDFRPVPSGQLDREGSFASRCRTSDDNKLWLPHA